MSQYRSAVSLPSLAGYREVIRNTHIGSNLASWPFNPLLAFMAGSAGKLAMGVTAGMGRILMLCSQSEHCRHQVAA